MLLNTGNSTLGKNQDLALRAARLRWDDNHILDNFGNSCQFHETWQQGWGEIKEKSHIRWGAEIPAPDITVSLEDSDPFLVLEHKDSVTRCAARDNYFFQDT